MNILTREFYNRPTHLVAQELLGKYLVREIDGKTIIGMICETEAYTCDDPASHAFIGKTERNKSMFGPVGHAYVYISYGIHYCLNIVAREENCLAGGVLIRSVNCRELPKHHNITNMFCYGDYQNKPTGLFWGPGKLTKALSITKALDGTNIMQQDSGLYVCEGEIISKEHIQATPRIGISKAQDKLLRFIIK